MKIMEASEELIFLDECPFCGEKYLLSIQKTDTGRFYGQCDRCLSTAPLAGSKKAAAENWNARPKHECECKHDVPLSANVGQGVPF